MRILLPFLIVLFAFPRAAAAHCDSLAGPVVESARTALQTGSLQPLLPWVHAAEEAELRSVYKEVQHVREAGGKTAELADRYFFETAVRLHRKGEGAEYTGLKDEPPDRLIQMAEAALQTGDSQHLGEALLHGAQERFQERFAQAVQKRERAKENVQKGRAYVESYIALMHLVELLGHLGVGEH